MKEISLEQMASVAGSKSCGASLALYGIAFIGLCASTGGVAICAAITFGASLHDVYVSCYRMK
ncbi:MAG: hypothetical protein GX126_11910 [Bacteroidales bacterium]|jgi:hypothetical protein|nr:hypothetical protein [Bacteroidales bacterium]